MSENSKDSARPPSFVPPPIGELQDLIPDYEFLELIDRGGMGAVYVANQKKLNRKVAIKVLPNKSDWPDLFVERFHREAEMMAEFSHPNIVLIHDFGETSAGHLYIVMEYVDGPNLKSLIKEKRLDSGFILSVIQQTCEALQVAHDHGIIHRDVKPANILVTEEGRIKVVDFGIATYEKHSEKSKLSEANEVFGTPDYMAPEVIEGREDEIDHRADIYSIGVLIYEMLTGTVPRGAWAMPSKVRGSGRRYDGVVTRAMQKDREDRFENIQEIPRVFAPEGEPESEEEITNLAWAFGEGEGDLEVEDLAEKDPSSNSRRRWISIILIAAFVLTGLTTWLRSAKVKGDVGGREMDTQRELANWVIRRGGAVNLGLGEFDFQTLIPISQLHKVSFSSAIPNEDFYVRRVTFEEIKDFGDDELKEFVDLAEDVPTLMNLNLLGTSITSEGLKPLVRLQRQLTALNIEQTPAVHVDSVETLKQLRALAQLFLSKYPDSSSKMTDAAVQEIREQLPRCNVLWEEQY